MIQNDPNTSQHCKLTVRDSLTFRIFKNLKPRSLSETLKLKNGLTANLASKEQSANPNARPIGTMVYNRSSAWALILDRAGYSNPLQSAVGPQKDKKTPKKKIGQCLHQYTLEHLDNQWVTLTQHGKRWIIETILRKKGRQAAVGNIPCFPCSDHSSTRYCISR